MMVRQSARGSFNGWLQGRAFSPMNKQGRLALVLVGVALGLSRPATADSTWNSSEAVWRAMDLCTEQAQKLYPDFTHEGHLKREAYRLTCMRANNLPYAGLVAPTNPTPATPNSPTEP
jgi:hypothetical protein